MKRLLNISVLVSFLCLLVVPLSFASGDDVNRFFDRSAGFGVEKPASWTFMNAGVIEENRDMVRLEDEELERRIKEKAALPLVAFAKYSEPFDKLNPSFQVVLTPLGEIAEKPPVEILKLVIGTLKKAFADFTVVEEITGVKVDGIDAAYFKASYKVSTKDGREFKALSRMYLVPRGTVAFTITMTGPSEGDDVSEAEFKSILSSIEISR